MSNATENVLILQGGGSLGAFGCGVFKAFVNNNIKIDIIAGTSIGGVNAAIIAGSKEEDYPEQTLEQFWLELAENSINFAPPFIEWLLRYQPPLPPAAVYQSTTANTSIKPILSSYSSAVYGNSKMFIPRWRPDYASTDPQYFTPQKWTYMYDHSPLIKTLEKYINYNKLQPNANPNARLIITAVNVLTAEPLTFDSSKQKITVKHLLATSGYPLYGFPWIEVEKGVYAWDGSLLSNTPLREVIDAAPVIDKRIFLVENYPKNIDHLPKNLPEVFHRARDIVFSDKSEHNVKMSKVITLYLEYIEQLYQLIEKHVDPTKLDKKELKNIHEKYKKFKQERGAQIKTISYITRDEPFPYLYENADFSQDAIRNSIREGELKANQILKVIKIR
jgi:NTE family protein